MFGVDFTALKPVEAAVTIAPRPIFFIHGEGDTTIPVSHAYRLLEASHKTRNQLWVVPGAGHTQAYKTHPEEYISRLTTFFDAALK